MFCVILYHGLNRSFCWLSFLDPVRKYTKEQLLKIAGHYGLTLRLSSSRWMGIKVLAEKHSLGLEPVVAPLVTTGISLSSRSCFGCRDSVARISFISGRTCVSCLIWSLFEQVADLRQWVNSKQTLLLNSLFTEKAQAVHFAWSTEVELKSELMLQTSSQHIQSWQANVEFDEDLLANFNQ